MIASAQHGYKVYNYLSTSLQPLKYAFPKVKTVQHISRKINTKKSSQMLSKHEFCFYFLERTNHVGNIQRPKTNGQSSCLCFFRK